MQRENLRNRNFLLLLFGQLSSLMGNYTLKFALSMYVLEQTGSAAVFAALLSVALLPTILLSPLGGVLADRANRRTVMVALDALSGTVVLLAGLLLLLDHDIVVIGGLLVVLSVLGAFESPTVQACIPQMLTGDALLRGNAAVNQVSAIAGLAAPFTGSFCYTAFGLLPVLWGTAGCFCLTALLERFIQLPYRKETDTMKMSEVIRRDLAEGARFLCREQPDILKLLLLAALASTFVAGVVVVGFPFLVRSALGLSSQLYAAAESVMGAAAIGGALCVGLLAGRLRPRGLAGILTGFGLCLFPAGAAFLLPLEPMGRYLVLLLAFAVSQFGCSVFSTYAISMIQARTPERLMGKVMSCVFTLSLCAQPLGQILYGALFDWCAGGAHWVLLPSGLALCLLGLSSVRLFRAMEGEPRGGTP